VAKARAKNPKVITIMKKRMKFKTNQSSLKVISQNLKKV
jgi:hypothetical protein